jgi:hypothetical protein
MSVPMLGMALGRPPAGTAEPGREAASALWPVIGLVLLVVGLGLYVPPPLRDLLMSAAHSVGAP